MIAAKVAVPEGFQQSGSCCRVIFQSQRSGRTLPDFRILDPSSSIQKLNRAGVFDLAQSRGRSLPDFRIAVAQVRAQKIDCSRVINHPQRNDRTPPDVRVPSFKAATTAPTARRSFIVPSPRTALLRMTELGSFKATTSRSDAPMSFMNCNVCTTSRRSSKSGLFSATPRSSTVRAELICLSASSALALMPTVRNLQHLDQWLGRTGVFYSAQRYAGVHRDHRVAVVQSCNHSRDGSACVGVLTQRGNHNPSHFYVGLLQICG